MPWAPDYITPEQLKGFRRLSDDIDDAELPSYIAAASRAIDRCCHRQFGQTDGVETRQYTAWWNRRRGRWVVDIDDLMTDTSLAISVADRGTVDADGYDLEPPNEPAKGKPWTRLSIRPTSLVQPTGADFEVAVTADPFGWAEVPGAVTYACKLQSNRFASRRGSPFGIAGSPDQGSEMRLLARVDPDVAVSLTDYIRLRKAR